MREIDNYEKKIKLWRRWVFGGLFALFIFFFWKEISILFAVWVRFLNSVLENRFDLLNNQIRQEAYSNAFRSDEELNASKVFWSNFWVYLATLFFSLFNISQLALPVRTWDERKKAFGRILLFALRRHGPAVFVREGKIVASQKEMRNTQPGVALVDLTSAIVLEQQKNTWAWEGKEKQQQKTSFLGKRGRNLSQKTQKIIGRRREWIRVLGPGVVFTRKGERIHSVIDMRKQVRSKGDAQAFTRDGVELQNPVFVVFDLSGTPEVITVAYIGGVEKQNLYGVDVDEDNASVEITSHYELDAADAEEIHQFSQHGIFPEMDTKNIDDSPFPFDQERVFQAAFANAHVSETSTSWDDLPLRVTLDFFQKEMKKYDFGDLYHVDSSSSSHLRTIKENFGRRVKFQGKLSYRFLSKVIHQEHKKNKWSVEPFFMEDVRRVLESRHFEFSPPQELNAEKVLRDRGIKVIAAGFPELRVKDSALGEKILATWKDTWKARWEKEIAVIESIHELEARREIDHARAQTQRELTYILSDLFQKTEHTKEALALRMFQALERNAANGGQPRDVLSMLQSLYRWLLTQRKDFEKKSDVNKGHWVRKPLPPEDEK